MRLDEQSKKFCIVVRCLDGSVTIDDVKQQFAFLKRDLSAYGEFCMIIHDKDFDIETGDVMIPHIHINIFTFTRRSGGKMLKLVSESAGVPISAVSVDKIADVHASLRYLGHKDDIEKYPYCIDEVYASSCAINDKMYSHWLNDNDDMTAVQIIDIVTEMNFVRRDILSRLGITLYTKYRNIINDLIRDVKDK